MTRLGSKRWILTQILRSQHIDNVSKTGRAPEVSRILQKHETWPLHRFEENLPRLLFYIAPYSLIVLVKAESKMKVPIASQRTDTDDLKADRLGGVSSNNH